MSSIAVLGYGVVGSGVVELLEKNKKSIEEKAGRELSVGYILDRKDLSQEPEPVGKVWVNDFQRILDDPAVDMVVEAMGGLEPAYTYVKAALRAGKNVITSNKELVAAKGAELLQIARKENVNLLFEGSVGGGIPIIHPIHQCLGANRIEEIAGILNGTTNFILTKMYKEGMGFTEALAIAQELGYAEADPTADVEGIDACRKICILASLAFGKHIYPENVPTQGIANITAADVQYAEGLGCSIKLIGRARRTGDEKVEIMVSPALLRRSCQLAGIDDVFNGILVRCDALGDAVFYGRGAGKLPTASAVIADILDAARAKGTIPTLQWADCHGENLENTANMEGTFYLRAVYDGNGSALLEKELGQVQWLHREGAPQNELACVTGRMSEGAFAGARERLAVAGLTDLAFIRVLEY